MPDNEKPHRDDAKEKKSGANAVEKKQNERPVDLSSERLGRDDTQGDILPIGNPGIPLPPK